MKTIIFSTLLLLVFVAKSYGVFFCDEDKDCETDECCVIANTAQMLGKGVCRKLERAGTQCNEPLAALGYYGGKFLLRCPCKEGSDCEPTGTCRSGTCNAVVASKSCKTAADCKDGECCVAWSSLDLVRKGYCAKLERRGSRCNKLEAKVDYYGGKYVHYCPCAEGLVCEPKGGKDYKGFVDSSRLRCSQIPTTVDPDATIVTEPEEVTIPTVVAEGPGGEPPRDDDCLNWEYPC